MEIVITSVGVALLGAAIIPLRPEPLGMSILWLLIPISLLGATGLAPFSWAERSGQYEDIAGAAQRILDNEDRPPETLSSQ